jgi:regulator of nonsense transcripts 2
LHGPDVPAVFLKEIAALSLEKYISELVSASAEGLTRCKTAVEVWAGVEVRRSVV